MNMYKNSDNFNLLPKHLFLILAWFLFVVIICGCILVFTMEYFGRDMMPLAMVFSPAAFLVTAVIAFLTWRLNRLSSEEPWAASYRDIHKEFWGDKDVARVRKWLCCDEAYQTELLPILEKRLAGQVTSEEYDILEVVDRYLSIMGRIVYVDVKIKQSKINTQGEAWKRLGFMFWLSQIKKRPQLKAYADRHWPNLRDYLV